jgi:hypothetical protein
LTVAHLHALTWAIDCDAPRWFHTPLVLAIAAIGFMLAVARRRQLSTGAAMLGLATIYVLVGYAEGVSIALPAAWQAAPLAWLTHPLGGSICVFLLGFGVGAMLLREWTLLALAAALPVAWATVRSAGAVAHWRHGRGVVILLGAFALLAVGVALQWLAMRRPPRQYTPPDNVEPPADDGPDERPGPPTLPLS